MNTISKVVLRTNYLCPYIGRWIISLFFFQVILYGSGDRTIIIDHNGTTYAYDYNTNTYETKTSTSTYHGDSGSGAYDRESGKSIFVGWSASEGQVRAYDYSTDTWEILTNRPGTSSSMWLSVAYDSESDRIILAEYYWGGDQRILSYDYNTDTWEEKLDLPVLGNQWGAVTYIVPSYSGPTWHVSADGSDDNDGSEENPFATIQHGIDLSSDGDTVLVASGTYVENINYNGKNIVVQGEDRETTIIDGNQSGSVVTFENGEDSTAVLSGFTITNGSTNYGGGIYLTISSP